MSQMNAYEAHSVATTPAPTPPPARSTAEQQQQHQHQQAQAQAQQQQMAYHMNGGPPMANGGMMAAPNAFSGYQDPNVYAQQNFYPNGAKPQIYTAVYSNVSVFEMEVNGIAVMRRRADSWLNATQILKVAGVDKGKRTKVLEKEITGEHEKVQGGYGKYQGTWVNYQRGREFARQYGVEHLLLPLFEHDIGSDGTAGMSQGLETPTKEQAMAAQRKRLYGGDGRPMTQQSGGTFFKNMSNTAANAIHALNRTRLDSPSQMDGRRSMGPRRQSQTQSQSFNYGQNDMYGQGASQQSMHSMTSQDSFGTNGGIMSQGASFADFGPTEAQEPPRKRIRPSPQSSFISAGPYDGSMELTMVDGGAPTEPNASFFSQASQSFMPMDTLTYGLEPLPHPQGPLEEQKKELLLDLFINPDRTDFDDHPAFLRLSGDEFELPIDGSCNTVLHWAATLARIPLVRKLLEKGFNMRRANSGGETALIAACQARNNLDHNSFPALLQLLGPSIEVRDRRGRTLLHHIAVSSAMKGRAAVGKYYLECLLEYVIRQGPSPASSDGMNGMSSQPHDGPLTLGKFMDRIVNAQDKVGDTALNLAARTSTTTIIDQLIEVGADPHIANRGGLAPVDFGVGLHTDNQVMDPNMQMFDPTASATTNAAANGSPQKSFDEAQEGLLSSIREILAQSETDFSTEMKEKNEILDKTNAALKESGNALAEERRKLEEIRAKVREKEELEQKINNLRQAIAKYQTELTETGTDIQDNVAIGQADKGLDLDGQLSRVTELFPDGIANAFDGAGNMALLTQEQANFLDRLERAEVLCGRAQVYQHHNGQLEQKAKSLKARSGELEERYKKIVSLCTGADEDKVDGLLEPLVQAVISEQKELTDNTQLGRMREFLRLVQGAGL
ncbi:Transcription factor SWI6 [Exophiala dermatitidis]|uniref:Cell pattern formation-associated protein stuA n=1 Tax=Exophiala dermatitidis (strain ATCC 34100 / CBS 525.76 / NIH/UT8656) TaxID=858893 RepID=H6CBD9_EXODN|nr:regulatory protein SWI6 [Exophiala dermatitidis NIH/UT8656]EHY61086.1 regulatory protein SWI6 [Exophiala dermatitidis NIH/UT8656]